MIIPVVFLLFDLKKKGTSVSKDSGCIVFYSIHFLIVCICIGGYFVPNHTFLFVKKVLSINKIKFISQE